MPGSKKRPKPAPAGAACCAALLACVFADGAQAQGSAQGPAPGPRDAVRIPAGLNLGQTSYYDALAATTPGLTLIAYASRHALDEITGPDGRPAPGFDHPRVDVDVAVIQLIYNAHEFTSGCLGFNLLQPFVGFDTDFKTPGPALRGAGFGPGDTVIGAFFQSRPVLSNGRPVFYFRAELDGIVAWGNFDPGKDLNPGSGFGSLNPFLAFTILPARGLEISGRANYLYNFTTDRAANLAPVPGPPFRNGQAGQTAWLNFDASYQVASRLSLGANGYVLGQLTDDRFNGADVRNSRAQALYIGPGLHWTIAPGNLLNINYYFPVGSQNLPQGQKLNLQFTHPF